MLKSRVLIMLSLIFLAKCDDYIHCRDDFVEIEACAKLETEEDGLGCKLIDSKCVSSYSTCEQYKGGDSEYCKRLDHIDFRYYCDYDEEEGKCVSKLKRCGEVGYLGKDYCEGLSTGNSKTRCIFGDGWRGCSENYYSCEDIKDSENPDLCLNNIPSDRLYRCDFDYEKKECKSKKRTCIDYNDSYLKSVGLDLKCWELASETEGKTCILSFPSLNCEEGYRQCEEYNPVFSQSVCESIIPSDGKGNFNNSMKCKYENDKCVSKERKCEEFANGYDIHCTGIYPSDKTKRCLYYRSNCIEIPITCENYTENSKEICELITIYDTNGNRDYSHKCVFQDESCKTKQRECNEAINSEDCNNIVLSEKERCFYQNDKCEKFYKNCEDYEGSDINTCELITPFKSMYELDDENECVFENNKCVK